MLAYRVKYINVVILCSLASIGILILWQHPSFQVTGDISQHDGYSHNIRNVPPRNGDGKTTENAQPVQHKPGQSKLYIEPQDGAVQAQQLQPKKADTSSKEGQPAVNNVKQPADTGGLSNKQMERKLPTNIFDAKEADRFLDQLRQSESTTSNDADITKRFPWIVRPNYMPNFYTKRKSQQGEETAKNYSSASVVFVHNQKSGGSTLKLCMEDIAKDFHFDRMAVVCDINSGDYYTAMTRHGRHDLVKFHSGGHSFQTCDFASHGCAYVTVLRDPYERLISSYEYCKVRNELHCQIYDAKEVSVNHWAVFQGSFFFRQLLYNFEFCTQQSDKVIESLRVKKGLKETAAKIPCWYRNELVLSEVMNKRDKMKVLRYVLDHLEDWFAVMGINDDYDTFLGMLEGAFQLPFSRCKGSVLNYHVYTAEGEGGGVQRKNIVSQLKQQLMQDPEVQEALYFDVKIFEEARNIFDRQKNTYERNNN